jgi:hypothetical protein
MLLRRMTPVVVSSVPPMMSAAMSGALAVQHADDVGAVVHGDVGPVVDAGVDVAVVGLVVLALDGVDAHAVLLDQGGGDRVLRAQRIGGAEHDVGAPATRVRMRLAVSV